MNSTSSFSTNRFKRMIEHLVGPSVDVNKMKFKLNSDSEDKIIIIFWSFFFGFLYTVCVSCICYTCIMHKFSSRNIMADTDIEDCVNSNSISNEFSAVKPYFINIDNSKDSPPSYESLEQI